MNILPNSPRLLFMLAVFVAAPSFATVKEGDALTLPQLEDQFEVKQSLRESTEWLLFSHDMDGTGIAREALEGKTADGLNAAGIQYFADISGMPGLISRFIAIPKLKKLSYPVVLARDEEKLALIPREENKPTVIRLEQGTVQSIVFAGSPEQVKTLLSLE